MKKRVLVFPCGSEIGLEIYRSLKFSKDFELYGGSSVSDHGEFVYNNYISNIPFVDDDQFINKINKIVEEYKIDLIIPAHDSVVLKLSQNIDKIKAIIVTSSPFACDICRSKAKTYNLFEGILELPKIYEKDKVVKENFPLFLKPDVGQGAKGTKKIENFDDLQQYDGSKNMLLLEYLPGDEYTIDCFTDYKGNLLYCSGRKRNRISNGISVSTIEIKDDNFLALAKKINDKLQMNGAWFFQLKRRENGQLVLMEIATRVAGTMEYQRSFGVNLPLLSLYNALEIPVSIIKNNYTTQMDRALENVFKISYQYSTVYIDLDDTLLFENKVNYNVMAFLYKCLGESKRIVLLTRHCINPEDTLKKYNIDANIFEKIIHIDKNDKETKKSKFILEKAAIFIDDSYSERLDVYEKCNIPVFDVNMIDVLM